MSFEETFEKWLAADLADKEARKAAEVEASKPQYVTKEDLGQLFKGFAEEVAKNLSEQIEAVKASVEEQVEKALPVRSAGAGRVGQESGEAEKPAVTSENLVSYLVAKGRSDAGWSDEDKELVTGVVVGAARQGMKY